MKNSYKIPALLGITGALALAAVVFVLMAYAKTQPIEATDLKIDLDEFRSYAISGQLLAEQSQNKRLPSIYFENQCELLQSNLQQNVNSLNQAQPGFQVAGVYLQGLSAANSLSGDFGKLCDSFNNTNQLEKVRDTFNTLAEQFDNLSGKLNEWKNILIFF